ncbi:lipoprotein [Streptomyces sp. NPDC100445]|uniref:lipoprotein n=1 Tax=Streptomyces sp. NPDC100445 TaxID=3366102 RepID=UPI0038135A3E
MTRRTAAGVAVVVALLTGALGGCAGSDGRGATGRAGGEDRPGASGTRTPAGASPGGDTIGAAGSPCELPVRFAVARHWKAEPVQAGKESSGASPKPGDGLGGDLADSPLRQGPVTAVCEIDAKPAGNIGFLRVWKGRTGDADAGGVLRAFVAAEGNVSKAEYHRFTTGGGVPAVEVEYLRTSELLEETEKESAFAVSTPDGPVVLHLGGMDTEEHEEMRPAFDLAKHTLEPA